MINRKPCVGNSNYVFTYDPTFWSRDGAHAHCQFYFYNIHCKKVKVHTLDIAPLRSESPPQKRTGMARVLKGFHSFTCTPTCSSAIAMSHTCLCLPSRSWYSFTDAGGMEGWVDLSSVWCIGGARQVLVYITYNLTKLLLSLLLSQIVHTVHKI